jgi:hypothetical protein
VFSNLSHFTLGRHHPIEDRIGAAAAAGIDAIGLYLADYLRLKHEGRAPGELAELLDEHGVCLAEIEVLRAWVDDPDDRERMAQFETAAWELADRFACRYVQVIGPYLGPFEQAGQVTEVVVQALHLQEDRADVLGPLGGGDPRSLLDRLAVGGGVGLKQRALYAGHRAQLHAVAYQRSSRPARSRSRRGIDRNGRRAPH